MENAQLLKEALDELVDVEQKLAQLKLPDPKTPHGGFLRGLVADATNDTIRMQEEAKQLKGAVEFIFAIVANAQKGAEH